MTLFLTLFSTYPDTLNYFKAFENKSLDEIKGMSDMRAHATAVMYAMDSLIDNVDDPECMVGLVRKIARNHKGRNIGKARFEQLRSLYGNYLDTNLGNRSSAATKSAWDKFLSYMNNLIEKEQNA
ncbi:hypothetical protein SNE40_022021 [Patella caerulea]